MISGGTATDRRLNAIRRWLVLILAVAQAVLLIRLMALGFVGALETGDGVVMDGPLAPLPIAFLIYVPIMLGGIGFALLGLHPRYHDDMLFRRIGWLITLGLAASSARLAAGLMGMGWLTAPLGLLTLLFLGRALMVVGWWPRPVSLARRAVVNLPLGLHAGWLTALLPLNVLAGLSTSEVELVSTAAGGFIALVALLVIGIAGVRLMRAEPPYVSALLWMLLTVAGRGGVASLTDALGLTALLAALVILLFALWTRRQRRPGMFG